MQNYIQSIEENMNANGGGLAVNITGKYESNRHAIARQTKYTFGECAKEINKKKFGLETKISAAELLILYRAANGDPEWHHAGFLPKSYGGGMKKTYFLSEIPTLEDIKNWQKKAHTEKLAEIEYQKKQAINNGQLYIY